MSTLESLATGLETGELQGLVARGYAALRHAVYVPVAFDPAAPAAARAWVGALAAEVTPASRRTPEVRASGRALQLAFTAPGLEILGLPDDALGTFSREFQEGMATEHRSRQLGDTEEADPSRWSWGGPSNPPVHAMLFLFAESERRLDGLVGEQRDRAAAHRVTLHEPLATETLTDGKEHFGFHDGIAQPRIEGLPVAPDSPHSREPAIPAGEVVLGYRNAYDRIPASPTVADAGAARRLLPLAPPDPDRPGAPPRRDLGRNGSYVVFRQLEQDVRAFWRFADERTGGDPERRRWLAAKMVGRWPNGAPLVRHPEQEPQAFDPREANDFLYARDDPHGDRCPVGAHIRRCNPRDGLQPGPKESLLVSDRHRLLRRGRAYGRPLAASFDPEAVLRAPDDGERRGLHFICFNTDLARQFEFVQNTWANSMKFEGLYSDPDAVIAPHVDPARARHPEQVSAFTVQRTPVRRRETRVPRFVTMRGGAYLFLPSVPTLHYLAELD